MAVLFPGEQAWELWSGAAGDALELHHRFSEQEPGGFAPVSARQAGSQKRLVALPVRSVTAMPMWVNAPDEEGMHSAAELQLERSGLRARNESQGVDFSLIEKAQGRSLIVAHGLTDRSPRLAEKSLPPTDHVVAPYLLPLFPDHLTIWRELGHWVAAITRGGKVVFFDSLMSPELDASAIREVHRLAAQLSLLNILDDVKGVVLWTSEGDAQEIADASGLSVDRAARPGPIFSGEIKSGLEPRSARLARQREQQRQKSRKWLRNGLAAFGAIAVAVAGVLGYFAWQRHSLQTRVADLRPQASQVEAMQERWLSVAAAVDKDAFVLETLLAIQSIPAAASVSLEKIELKPGRIAIEGDAANDSSALGFLDKLSTAEQFSDYKWSFPQPSLSGGPGGGVATFEIEGINEAVQGEGDLP